jgi:hypothetical protein
VAMRLISLRNSSILKLWNSGDKNITEFISFYVEKKEGDKVKVINARMMKIAEK